MITPDTTVSRQLLTESFILSLSHPDLTRLVAEIDNPATLRWMAGIRFAAEAQMVNDDLDEPFIRWPVVNVVFQPWLSVLLAKVVRAELSEYLNGNLMLISVPRSATAYMRPIIDSHIFPDAYTPWVLKKDQLDLYGVKSRDFTQLPVPSYVHSRDPLTHSRGTEDIFFFNPNSYAGRTALVFDDALAEGLTAQTIAEFLKAQGVAQVLYATPMAKQMQAGEDYLRSQGLVDAMSILVQITAVSGKDQPIEFNVTPT